MSLSYNFGGKGGESNVLVKKPRPLSVRKPNYVVPSSWVCVYVCETHILLLWNHATYTFHLTIISYPDPVCSVLYLQVVFQVLLFEGCKILYHGEVASTSSH